MAGTSISFDSNSLQTANILTQDINHASLPTKNASPFAISHANKSTIPYINYPSKQITISGEINGTSIADLDTRIDTFKSYFIGANKNLDIGYNSGTRRYTATVTDISITRPGGLFYATFSVTFFCIYPFGLDTSQTTALSAGPRSNSTYSDAFTVAATAPYQLMIATITYTAAVGAGLRTMTFGNSATGQQITINRGFLSTDVVVIDCTASTVMINGALFDFAGGFPQFGTGAQTMTYNDTLDSRTFSISVVYTGMWL
jgi:hypothetical protein